MASDTAFLSYGLWFSGNAKEAIDFYKTVFRNVEITEQADYTESGQEKHGQQPGTLMFANFTLEDAKFQAINGGNEFVKNPSISFFINCETPEEAEQYWFKLAEKGKALMPLDAYDWSPRYGWVEDEFGVSWQVYTIKGDETVKQKINPSLMFVNKAHGRAEEAINYYTSVFPNSQVQGILKYPAGGMDPEGTVMHSQFVLNGQTIMAMDSAEKHAFGFNGGVSLVVNCETQEAIDYYWDRLLEGGQAWECGWLVDKFGIAWQIVPTELDRLMTSGDKEAVKRITEEMMSQVKLDIGKLKAAYNRGDD